MVAYNFEEQLAGTITLSKKFDEAWKKEDAKTALSCAITLYYSLNLLAHSVMEAANTCTAMARRTPEEKRMDDMVKTIFGDVTEGFRGTGEV